LEFQSRPHRDWPPNFVTFSIRNLTLIAPHCAPLFAERLWVTTVTFGKTLTHSELKNALRQ